MSAVLKWDGQGKGPHYNILLKYIRRRLGAHKDLAEDMLQDIYLRVRWWERTVELRKEEDLRYWYGVAAHVTASFHDAQKTPHRDILWQHTVAPEDLEELGGAGRMEETVENLSLIRYLMGGSYDKFKEDGVVGGPEELGEVQKQVILLHKAYGFEYKEVAKLLNLSIHTVEKYVTQALWHMRQRAKEGGWKGGS